MSVMEAKSAEFKQILVEGDSSVRRIILNRPKQLNALSFQMVSSLLDIFLHAEKDDNLNLVILKGKGRAFCAGGDVATVVREINNGNAKFGADFFRTEFTLNYVMATYTMPQVSILDGIVMGGGAGASIHGNFRVATENTVFAMPETGIGLFPDVGATYFLPRLPGFFGEYVGLTGCRLDGADMLACGLATHFVPSERLPSLEAALGNVNSRNLALVSAIIDEYSELPNLKEMSAYSRLDIINDCFSRRTVEEILNALERKVTITTDYWISSTIQLLKKASPTSLKISLRSIREGRLLGIGQCLVREYRMVCHVMSGRLSKDLLEGCRAVLLDKDKNPKWEPSSLQLVNDEMVDSYFMKAVNNEDYKELDLPLRPDLPIYALAKL
ncbi:3-hydroxyisobutyryl-CoA hydrolase 1-like [Impatiens glandulifera]|uniref:3-hydroxyisobutyryl-CoA hydrolase 1-like n=1 Tax=Impatiens glandulifera TaxID=253017 RepID=UPI001FB10E3F|nr:3-hydroxyisobutyryl-CoA hydrolase 1-like [Impatiens glandulifera]